MKTNSDYWTELLTKMPESFQNWFKEEKTYLQKHIVPNSKVLDIGCGDGRSISDIISITKNIIGIDHDKNAIDSATNKFSNYSSIKFIQEEASNLSFNNDTFDFIICMGTFANFADKKFEIIQEMRRVLKDTGKIIISVYSENALKERIKLYKITDIKINKINNSTIIFDKSLYDNISEQFSKAQLKDIFTKEKLHISNLIELDIAYLCTLSKL